MNISKYCKLTLIIRGLIHLVSGFRRAYELRGLYLGGGGGAYNWKLKNGIETSCRRVDFAFTIF